MNTITTFHVWRNGDNRFYSEEEAQDFAAAEIADLKSKGYNNLVKDVKVESRVNGFANYHMYTDVEPFEIIKIISDKTIEVRVMNAERLNDPEIVVGGFAGHCTNNRAIKYDYSSNEEGRVVRLRKKKNGEWGYKGMRFILSENPYKFYDYNF